MSSATSTRPTAASAQFFKLCARVLQPVPKRHVASYKRARSRLNIKPDPAFLPSKTEPHDHIIYNPPPSMPNVFHTPTIFLPADDKRRAIRAAIQAQQPQQQSAELAPPVHKPYTKRYHLSGEDVDEMRRLRKEDPYKWTNTALHQKFDCSKYFVSIVIKGLAKEKAAEQNMVKKIIASNRGIRKRTILEDRAIRREKWYRDA
jgi:hypothetical protein